MIELTEQQRLELASPEPVAIDPVTQAVYVLVRKEAYDRIRSLLDDDLPSMQEVAQLVESNMKEDDANDPWLESYQEYLEKP